MEERQRTVSGRELPENSETTGMTGIFIIFSGERDFYTASVSTFPERHSAWWFQAGFQETYNEGHTGMESGEKVLPYALDWLDRNGTKKRLVSACAFLGSAYAVPGAGIFRKSF